jgi:thioredoxin 1
MASKNIVDITEANFDTEVAQSQTPVLVDFWAPWCGPCRALGPTIDKIADRYAGKVKVGKCNTDENMELASRFGISGIPHVMVFQGGSTPVESLVGAQNEAAYTRVLDKLLAS